GFETALCTIEASRLASLIARSTGKRIRIHVKVDTGMGRLGITPEETPGFLKKLRELPLVEPVGLFSHFPMAASTYKRNTNFSMGQIRTFGSLLVSHRKQGMPIT